MTDVSFTLDVVVREQHGRRPSRRMRNTGWVPAVIYGSGKPAESISLEARVLRRVLKDERIYTSVITLNYGDRQETALLRDLQMHPYKEEVLHMDFLRVHQGESVHLHVPIHLINDDHCAGVKAGGVLHRALVEVEIQAPVGQLPESINVDISNLQVGESIHLSQVQVPAGVTITALQHHDDKEVVSVHASHAPVEEDNAE